MAIDERTPAVIIGGKEIPVDRIIVLSEYFTLTTTGLQIDEELVDVVVETDDGGAIVEKLYPTFEQWRDVGLTLQGMEQAVLWALGDWGAYGDRRFGEDYAQAVPRTGKSIGRLYNLTYTARNVPKDNRRDDLTVAHHTAVASVPQAMQRILLHRAAEQKYTVKETRSAKQRMLAPDATVECRNCAGDGACPTCDTAHKCTSCGGNGWVELQP